MKKILIILIILITPLLLASTNYNYSFYGEAIYSVPGLTFEQYFNEHTLETSFSKPEYFVVHNEKIYVIDSGNSSLYVIDDNFKLKEGPLKKFTIHPEHATKPIFEKEKVIIEEEGIENEYITFKNPEGIDIRGEYIYIADTMNQRVIKMTLDYQVIDIFRDPVDPVFKDPVAVKEEEERRIAHLAAQEGKPEGEKEAFVPKDIPGVLFHPSKITVDDTERVYVIAKDVFEGIIELSPTGEFNRFTGVNPLKLTAGEIFRRSLMSEAQLKNLKTYLPTTFTSIKMGDGAFIYATSRASENNDKNMIQLINPKGIDVLKRNGYVIPMGDFQYIRNVNNHVIEGPSELVDIDYTEGGIYSVLDKKRSRVFTYDQEGNLLYITGSEGEQSDKFKSGVSIGYLGTKLIVLDQNSKTFVVYQLSNFGELVNRAVYLEYIGDYESSKEIWEEIIRLNVNYEIAYNGIGRYLLREGRFKEAVEYFKLGHDSYYYSKAFQQYRNDLLRRNFGWIFGGILVITIGLIALNVYKKYKRGDENEADED